MVAISFVFDSAVGGFSQLVSFTENATVCWSGQWFQAEQIEQSIHHLVQLAFSFDQALTFWCNHQQPLSQRPSGGSRWDLAMADMPPLLVLSVALSLLLNTHTFPSTTLKTWKLIDGGNKLYTWSKIDTICPLTRPSKIDLNYSTKT